MRENSSSVLTSLSKRGALRCKRSMVADRWPRSVRLRDELFERREHQSERGAELVTDVAEERGLGAVQLGQRLGTLFLLFVSRRAADTLRNTGSQRLWKRVYDSPLRSKGLSPATMNPNGVPPPARSMRKTTAPRAANGPFSSGTVIGSCAFSALEKGQTESSSSRTTRGEWASPGRVASY